MKFVTDSYLSVIIMVGVWISFRSANAMVDSSNAAIAVVSIGNVMKCVVGSGLWVWV